MTMQYRWLADAVLVLHVAIVVFVVAGLLVVPWGHRAGWRWIHRPGFRMGHLAAIAVVVAQSWLGVVCPLTTFEMWLRTRAGAPAYDGSFIGHWLQRLLYYDAPPWVFVVGYSVFGLLVALAWWRYPPVWRPASPAPQPSRQSGEEAKPEQVLR